MSEFLLVAGIRVGNGVTTLADPFLLRSDDETKLTCELALAGTLEWNRVLSGSP